MVIFRGIQAMGAQAGAFDALEGAARILTDQFHGGADTFGNVRRGGRQIGLLTGIGILFSERFGQLSGQFRSLGAGPACVDRAGDETHEDGMT